MKIPAIAGLALAMLALCFSAAADAAINLSGTRVVLAAPAKEASLLLQNASAEDFMLQAWVEADATGEAPFAITPALDRLRAGQQKALRILYYGEGLPTDKESVFWLNVQEVPQKARTENTLQIAVRQRLKLFYRPAGLPGKAEDAAKELKWKLVDKGGKTLLEVTNPSRFHVSFASVAVRKGAESYSAPIDMVAPGSSFAVEVPGLVERGYSNGFKVEFQAIGDYGGMTKHINVIAN
ncbi:molecular chaperone [Pseudomonas chlororaphis]|uniref:Molecular chaperone n=1 Tax=Pseudomonas chlororaphis TaxID=587753 RepID=A0A0D5Y469_9PSED|nr:molecular chaperone [Pseudomonas chlororaphis]AKA25779.1 molecular chaperone [Pseudomonas chlororaphis]